MTQHFDPTKPVKTRDGRKARILAMDLKDDMYPIAAAVTQADGTEAVLNYMGDGKTSDPTGDLVNLPEPPAALSFPNLITIRVCPDSPSVVQLGGTKTGLYCGVLDDNVPALINWLQQYLVSRQ